MPSPFPGMDPYLETPDLWPDVHHELISDIRDALKPTLRPTYVARIELRVYVETHDEARNIFPDVRIEKTNGRGRRSNNGGSTLAIAEPMVVPLVLDETIEEARLEIRHVKTGTLVTVIEVLSPANKIPGSDGRKSFMQKRRETLVSDVHWVEIDLLRAGAPTQPMRVQSDYRVLVSKASDNRRAQFWPINHHQPLPVIGIPLRSPDKDVPLDLGAVLNMAYDRAAYDLSVDYTKPPDPPLAKADAKWADKSLRSRGLR
ncbi:MAG: DUF4058 family protein [Planctomycetes bacterium]|nr:DUF4058 family protein [Planctomycetota bacterium]